MSLLAIGVVIFQVGALTTKVVDDERQLEFVRISQTPFEVYNSSVILILSS